MTEAFFSLALPIRDGLPGLKRAIEALQRQTYQNFELIVQDGGSTDASLDYVRQAKLPRIDIVSEQDSGIAQAYDRALTRCAGPLVVPLACDEWLDDDALETFASWYREHPDAAFVYGGARLWKNEAEIHSLFYPGRYDLLQFLASEMTPTAGGFYNKKVIGPDFHLDEGLKTCPDFDLFIRLGLRFDGLHIVEKRAIRFNAMVDRSSMTYRPESFDQFAHDRRYILERFFLQQGNCPLNDYVRRYCVSSMYAHLASALLDIRGETLRVQRFVIEAARQNPGSDAVIKLVERTRTFYFDMATGQVGKRNIIQPELVPRAARQMLGVIDLSAVDCEADWQADGAATAHDDQALSITTGRASAGYAAQIPLNFSDDLIHGGWYWMRLSMLVEEGQVGVAIRMPGGLLEAERLISADAGPVTLVLPFVRTAVDFVIRNGTKAGSSVVRLFEATVYGMPIPDDGNGINFGMKRKPSSFLADGSERVDGMTNRVEVIPNNHRSAAIAELAATTRDVSYSEPSKRKRNVVQPDLVPHAARQMLGVIDLSEVDSEADWQADGAATAHDGQALSITTGRATAGYATRIPLKFNDDLIHGGWYWLRLSMQVESGQVGVAIEMPGGSLKAERLISTGRVPVTLILPFVGTAVAVLVRNGGKPGQSVVRVLGATVYGMPIPGDTDDAGYPEYDPGPAVSGSALLPLLDRES